MLRLRNLLLHLRHVPADLSHPEARRRQRLRMVAWGTITAAISKVASGLTMILGVALTARYLNHELFGLWMTFFAALVLMNVANFGINNGALNSVNEARAESDAAVRAVVGSSFLLLTLISAALALILVAVFPLINWSHLLNITDAEARAQAAPSVMIFAACFLVNNVVSVIQRIQCGLQLNWLADLWGIAGQLLACAGIALTAHEHGGLPWLILSACGAPALAWFGNCVAFCWFSHPQFRPQWRDVNRRRLRALASAGGLFVVLDLAYLAGNATDTLVIARELGVAAVAGYAVVQKLSQGLGLSQLFMLPLWPAFGDALARGDHAWARRVLTRALLVALALGTGAALVILIAGRSIINVWSGHHVLPTPWTLSGFACWSIVTALVGTLTVFLNNSCFLKAETWWYSFASMAAVTASVALTASWHNPAGAVWARTASYGLLYLVPGALLAFREIETVPCACPEAGERA